MKKGGKKRAEMLLPFVPLLQKNLRNAFIYKAFRSPLYTFDICLNAEEGTEQPSSGAL